MKKILFVLLVWWLPCLSFAQKKAGPVNFHIDNVKKDYIIEVYSSRKPGVHHMPVHDPKTDTAITIFKESIVLSVKTKQNVSITVKDEFVNSIRIFLKDVDTFKIKGALNARISVQNGNELGSPGDLGVLEINRADISLIDFQNGCLDGIVFKECNVAKLNLNNTMVPITFKLSQVRLDTTSFYNTQLPHYFTLDTVDVAKINTIVDFTYLRNINKNSPYGYYLERTLIISDTDLDKFKLQYDRFNFHVDTAQGITKSTWIYEKMLRNLSAVGLTDKYEYYKDQLTDFKDKKNHSSVRNDINKYWWDNGHNRRKLFYNSVGFFSFFLFFNLIFSVFCYKTLEDVYMPTAFKEYFPGIKLKYRDRHSILYKLLYLLLFFLGSFFYTASIFWGLWLDMNSLKLKNIPILIFVLFQYIMGLICVAYIVGIIIVDWKG